MSLRPDLEDLLFCRHYSSLLRAPECKRLDRRLTKVEGPLGDEELWFSCGKPHPHSPQSPADSDDSGMATCWISASDKGLHIPDVAVRPSVRSMQRAEVRPPFNEGSR